jgi:CHAT domain-containing protein
LTVALDESGGGFTGNSPGEGQAASGSFSFRVSDRSGEGLAVALIESDRSREEDVRGTLGDVEAPPGAPGSLGIEELQALLQEAASTERGADQGYRPAILMLSFSDRPAGQGAEPGGTDAADSFLDLTLISEEGDPIGRRVELSRQEFVEQLRALYRQLARQELLQVDSAEAPARRLHNVLIGPVADTLERQRINTLLLVPDRGLQAVPYAALHDGSSHFGLRYGFSVTPSLKLTSLSPRRGQRGRVLAAGASEFKQLAPLPLVPNELAGIPGEARVDRYLNRAFTPDVLSLAADSRYERIHVATHAEFQPGGPDNARIYTGTEPVSLKEFRDLRQKRGGDPLELFALSACRTALGDGDAEMGFAGLALQAGARSAIGTLWYVQDEATSLLFLQFYRYLDAGLPKAEALRATREAMASGVIRLVGDQVLGADGTPLLSGLTKNQQRRIASGLQHPYFWAGILLLGTPW